MLKLRIGTAKEKNISVATVEFPIFINTHIFENQYNGPYVKDENCWMEILSHSEQSNHNRINYEKDPSIPNACLWIWGITACSEGFPYAPKKLEVTMLYKNSMAFIT